MTLSEIINADEKILTVAEKLAKITEIVEGARKSYGNPEVEIATPTVNTCEGMLDISYLSDADKLALAAAEIKRIRILAIEAVEATDGAVLQKEQERLLAVNSTLVNLGATTEGSLI